MTSMPPSISDAAEAVPAPVREPAASARRPLRAQVAELRGRYDALPANRRWLVLAAALAIGYLAVDEFVWSWGRAWAEESSQIEMALARGARRTSSVSTELKRSVATFGAVEVPGPAATGREELARAIDEVARAHKVAGYSYEARTGQRVKDPDTAALGGSIERLQADVKFEIAADELPKFLAALESNPAIDGVTTLRLQKLEQARKVSVQATIEAWVVASGRGPR